MKMPVFRSFFRALMRSVCDFVGVDYCSAKDYKSSISSKSKCALRAVIAFFVASATLIATFVVAPSSALSASQDGAQQNVERSTNAQNNVQQSGAQNNSAQNGINKDEVKRQVNSYEPPNSPEPPNSYGNAYGSIVMADGSNRDNKKEDAHGSDNASSKDKNKVDANVSNKVDNNNNIDNASKDDEKLNNGVKRNGKAFNKASNSNNKDDSNKDNSNKDDSNKAGDSAKLDNKLEKSAKHRRVKRALSGGEGNEPWRNDLAECKKHNKGTFAECYKIHPIFRRKLSNRRVEYGITYSNRGELITSSEVRINLEYLTDDDTHRADSLPQGTSLKIIRNTNIKPYDNYNNVDGYDWFYFKGENGEYNTKTTNKILAKDIFIGYFSSKWMNSYIRDHNNSHSAIIEAHYPDGSIGNYKFRINESYSDKYKKISDFPMNVYESEYTNKDEKINKNLEKSGYNVTRISTQDSDGNYSKITPIFIESTSEKKFESLRHFMVCHKEGSDGENDYTLNNVNGLKLSGSSDGTSQNNEYESEHMEHKKRPAAEKKNSGGKLYEDDDYLVQSRSWISGTPREYGKYVCKVFVIRDTKIVVSHDYRGQCSNAAKEFFEILKKEKNFKELFDKPQQKIRELSVSLNDDTNYINNELVHKKDWDYKEIKIVVSDSPPGPQHGDLSLNVYPFKSNGGAAPTPLADNSTVSVMRRMELKPFIDATSDVDNNQITFKMLCSKGEVSGSTGEGANESTVADTGTSESRNGSSIAGASTQKSTKNLVYKNWSDGLITLNAPIVHCDSSKIGDKNCNSNQSAAQTSMTAQVNSNVAGDYKCVVYALKSDALKKFNAKFGAESKPVENGDTLLDSETDLEKTIAWNSFVFNIYISDSEGFSLPNTGERNWNLQLGAIAAVMVSVLAAAFILNHSNWQREQAALRKAAVPM